MTNDEIINNQNESIRYLQKQRAQDYQKQLNDNSPNYLSIILVVFVILLASPVLLPFIIFIFSKIFNALSIIGCVVSRTWINVFCLTCEKLNLFDDN